MDNCMLLSEFSHRSSIRKIDGYWFERLSRPNQLKHFNIRIKNYVVKISQLEDVFRITYLIADECMAASENHSLPMNIFHVSPT
ncbi:hypothetical protein B9Z55_007844 [Caenorhabditis nigoni]|uniref:Uncharacterized protein n=1 Tax=Caenorhabditis nigoni TaxID=1611254 RepID=A0A2G5VBM5_9PELO|nr:hypothetical protein B9Z55_007844 [Caenorhabditis nigoni]